MHVTKPNKSPRANLGPRTAHYGKVGLAIGSALSVLPLISYLLFGNTAFAELHTSLPRVFLLYIIGGCIAGVLVGVVMPIIKTTFLAWVIGSIIGVMGGCAMQIMGVDNEMWTFDSVATIIVLGIGLGGSLGAAYHRGGTDISG